MGTDCSWGIQGAVFNQKPEVTYVPSTVEEGKEKLATKALSGLLTYEEILPGIRLEYCLRGHDIKENLVLKDPEALINAPEDFVFKLRLENRMAVQKDEKTVSILNPEGEEEYTISAPYMVDAISECSDSIQLFLQETEEENVYDVRLIPDQEWLLDKDRVYPVTVDPSIAFSYQGYQVLNNVTVYSKNPTANMYNYGELRVGRSTSRDNMRTVFKIVSLPTLSESDMIIQASISFKVNFYSEYGPSHSGTTVMNLFPMTQNVTLSSLTWNTIAGTYSDKVTDSQWIEPNEATYDQPRVTWDITRAVKNWYNTGTNYGMALVSENESPSTIRYLTMQSATSASGLTSNSPIFTITYLNHEGLESYLTYHGAGSDTLGNIYVSDFTGNLVYTHSDIDMSGGYFPISISHVYNHSRRGTSDLVGSGMKYGNGMRLNLSMRIESCLVAG